MGPIEYLMAGVAVALAVVMLAAFPQIIRDACTPEPPILTPTARHFCRLLFEANQRRGDVLMRPPGYLYPSWYRR